MGLFSSIGDAISSGVKALSGSSSSGGTSWGDLISTGLQIGGSLLQNHSASTQANAQIAAGKAQQQDYLERAQDDADNAARVRRNAALQAQVIRQAGSDTAANAFAAYAGSGVIAGQGSAGFIPAHIYGQAESDAFTALAEGNDQAALYEQQQAADTRAAGQYLTAGQIAASGTKSAANATLLTQAGSLANRWVSNVQARSA